jgi:hypothetical protein
MKPILEKMLFGLECHVDTLCISAGDSQTPAKTRSDQDAQDGMKKIS